MTVQTSTSYTATVRSFIPLLYVAWADGLLSPSEVQLIHNRINDLPHLTDEEKELLFRWSDPADWPDSQTFKDWMSLLKETGKKVKYQSLQSIVELGIAMSRRSEIGLRDTEEAALRETLQKLEEELELPGLARFRSIARPEYVPGPSVPTVRTSDLQSILDGESATILSRLKRLLSDPFFEIENIREKEPYRQKVLSWLQALARQGYGSLGFPSKYGGQNSMIKYAAVFEVLSYHDLSLAVKFGVQFGLFGGSIHHLGTERHHEAYLKDVGTGNLLGCFAMTETGHGSNVRDLETTATYDHQRQELIVHTPHEKAGKEYIGNALHGKMATVFAQLIVDGQSHGVHAVLVSLRDSSGQLLEGIRVEDNGYKMGLNGVDNGRIWFDNVRVPRQNLLNRFGRITDNGRYESPIENPGKRFFTMLGTLVAGRICVGMGALSAAKLSLTIAIKYGLRRRQFGPDNQGEETLILDYPSHQRRLLPRLATAYAIHFALKHLINRYEGRTEADTREIETLAAGVKAYATWFANDTIQECREACGGKGYLWENRIPTIKADADIFATFEGDNTVLMQLVSKGLLSDFRDEFGGGGFLSAIKYLSRQVSDSMIRINPIYKRKTDADHLNDPRFHHHAFSYRERKTLFALGSRMRNMFRKRITPYDVFLRTQNHMLTLAEAFVERSVLQEFQKVVSDHEGTVEGESLNHLCTLFALSTIERHKGWYLEHDYLEGIKTKAIRRRIDRLCAMVREDALTLIDAFGIPNASLDAPIAMP